MIYETRSHAEPPAISKMTAGTVQMPLITGYAAVFNSLSEPMKIGSKIFREIVRPGAFLRSIFDATQGKSDIIARFDHAGIFGRISNGTLSLREDERGLRYEITPPNTSDGRDLVELIRRGDIRASSFAFVTGKDNWRNDKSGQLRELLEVRLLDVSAVVMPAYPETTTKLWLTGAAATMSARLQLAEATL